MTGRIIAYILGWIASTAISTFALIEGRTYAIDSVTRVYGNSADWISLVISMALAALLTAGYAVADRRNMVLGLFSIHPAGFVIAAAVGYGMTQYSLSYGTSRHNVLTEDCFYVNAPVYELAGGSKLIMLNNYAVFLPSYEIVRSRPNMSGSTEMQAIQQ